MKKHGMDPARIDVLACAYKMVEDMERGLSGAPSSMPMIPTYLKNDGGIRSGETAIVIDAGGTNFRTAVATFTDGTCEISELRKWSMPGIDEPVTWEGFISFVADCIMPVIHRAEKIGFCFSYPAEITAEIDGRVARIDKEVVVKGCKGQLVGASLLRELESRGVFGKRVVILNDTAAVLLGGAAKLDKSAYGGFIGQVSGTGTNTCCILPLHRIPKLNRDEDTGIIVNLESGMYGDLPTGDLDAVLDDNSNIPGEKCLEKLTAGVYLGELCRLCLLAAEDEGLVSQSCADFIREKGKFNAATVDAWACGEGLDGLDSADAGFVSTVSRSLFERSAKCMAVNLTAILLLTGEGTDENKPVCILAEGSLVQKSRIYAPLLREFLAGSCAKLSRHAELHIDYETTLPGSAAAAILN